VVYVVPQTVVEMGTAVGPVSQTETISVPSGLLVLDVQPGNAQVFVDGAYVGTPDEARGEFVIEAGVHRVRIEEPGFEAAMFNVNITANKSMMYSRRLAAVEAPSLPAADTPVAAKTFYYIPGCYLGDLPPNDAGLPATCDTSHVQTFKR